MSPAPAVSIIIPAFNAAPWLKDAVHSVLAQSYRDWELIVVNDGSTDGTSALAKSFNDPRIRVIDQTNAGVSAARNAGMAAAQGNLFAFLDADDAMLPETLARKVGALRNSGVDWVFGDMALCNPLLEPTGEALIGTRGDVLRTVLLNISTAVPGASSNLVIRRRCFEQGVAFDTSLSNSADQDFTVQLAARFSYQYVPDAANLYRIMPGTMSKNVSRYQEDHLRFFRKVTAQGFLHDRRFRNECMANVYWAIGGSWWIMAHKPAKAIPFFFKAVLLNPRVLVRPIRKRVKPWLG